MNRVLIVSQIYVSQKHVELCSSCAFARARKVLAAVFDSSTHTPSKCIPLSPSKYQTYFCSSCFDEVCARCSNAGDGVLIREGIKIDEKPVCAEPPLGATTLSSGTTVANLTLKQGYFRTSNKSHDILPCYKESACQGGSDAGKYCTSGYTGPCEQ